MYVILFIGIDNLNKRIAIRYSEIEPIEEVMLFENRCSWVWVDIFTKLPLDKKVYDYLSRYFKICLVCPERLGRPEDIPKYIEQMKKDDIKIDAIMTSKKYTSQWERSGVLKPFILEVVSNCNIKYVNYNT